MKILSTILYSLFVALIVAVAGLFVVTLLPIPGNVQVKIVKSGSMEPAIHTGAIVAVLPADSYAVGDIITFEDRGKKFPTTHRVVEVKSDGRQNSYVTKGDANEEIDQATVARSDVIGKVLFNVPYAGYILDFARQPLGFTLMIGVPAGIIILDELVRIFTEVQKIRSTPASTRRKEEEESTLEPMNATTRTLDLRRL